MAQPRELVPDRTKGVRSAIAVLDARLMNDGKQQQAERIGYDVTLARPDASVGINQPLSTPHRPL